MPVLLELFLAALITDFPSLPLFPPALCSLFRDRKRIDDKKALQVSDVVSHAAALQVFFTFNDFAASKAQNSTVNVIPDFQTVAAIM